MKILINTSTTFKGGGVQVAKSFIEECKNITEHTYHVILGDKIAQQINQETFPENFTFSTMTYRPAEKVKSPFYDDKNLKLIEEQFGPDVVFTTSGPSYCNFKAPHLIGYNLPHYIYTDSPFFDSLSLKVRLRWKLKGKMIIKFYKRDADAIVGQTNDVRVRAGKLLNKNKAFYVSNTCNSYFRNYEPSDKKILEDSSKFRLLILSSYYTHKNFEIINQIAQLIDVNSTDLQFILTIDPQVYDRIFTDDAKKIIHNLGPIPIQDAPHLYTEVDAIFQPSLLECFSANYPEAMIMGVPIITTTLSFATDVCGDAALYYSPVDAKDAFQKINDLKDDKGLQEKLIEEGKKQLHNFLTPEQRAKEYIKICLSLINKS